MQKSPIKLIYFIGGVNIDKWWDYGYFSPVEPNPPFPLTVSSRFSHN